MTTALQCPHCGAQRSANDKFCAHCGKKIDGSSAPGDSHGDAQRTVVCSSCGRVNPSSEKICYGCGSQLDISTGASGQRQTSAASRQTQSGKKKKPLPTKYVLGIFIVLAIGIIGIEYVSAPSGGTNPLTPPPQLQTQTTDPSVLTEINNLEARTKADPKDSEALLQLANRLHDAKFYPRAIETYKQFLALKPNESDARVDMAICYFETEENQRAVQEIESVIKKQPNHQMATFNLGVIQLSMGNLEVSKKWLQKAVDIDPNSPAGQRAQELLKQH